MNSARPGKRVMVHLATRAAGRFRRSRLSAVRRAIVCIPVDLRLTTAGLNVRLFYSRRGMLFSMRQSEVVEPETDQQLHLAQLLAFRRRTEVAPRMGQQHCLVIHAEPWRYAESWRASR